MVVDEKLIVEVKSTIDLRDAQCPDDHEPGRRGVFERAPTPRWGSKIDRQD
jgi:hypothetical protein